MKIKVIFISLVVLLYSNIALAAEYLYVPNRDDATVSVIEASTSRVLENIPVMDQPLNVIANSAGTRVYVANYGSDTISVIDTTNNTAIAIISIGNPSKRDQPMRLALNPTETRLYVTNHNDNIVSVIDTTSNSIISNINVGVKPVDIIVDKSNTFVYVTNSENDTVSVIDANTNIVVNTLSARAFPHSMAINQSGSLLYVSNGNADNVSVFDTNTNTEIATITVGDAPRALAFNPSETRLYVANARSNDITVIDTALNTVITTITSSGTGTYGITVNSAGTLAYVTNQTSNNVSVIDLNSNSVINTFAVGNRPYTITNVTSSPSSNCSYSIPNQSNRSSYSGIGIVQVSTDSNCSWTAKSNADWITIISGEDGTGNGTVGFSITENLNPDSRNATLNIGGQTLSITQFPAGQKMPLYPVELACRTSMVTNSQFLYSAFNGTGSIQVETTFPNDCLWSATSFSNWITITSGDSYIGGSTVNYVVEANTTTKARVGSLSVGERTFIILQSGLGNNCIYNITPSSYEHSSSLEAGRIQITTPPNCVWSASTLADWINITSTSFGIGDSALSYYVVENISTQPRSSGIIVMDKTFSVTQAGINCTYAISPSNNNYSSDSNSGSITITASDNRCQWNASSNTSWVTISSSNNGTGDGSISYSITANTDTQQRIGTLMIAGQIFTLTQAGINCNFTLSPTSREHSAAAETGIINVIASHSNCQWNVVSNVPWFNVTSSNSGTGSGIVSYRVSENFDDQTRTNKLLIAGQTFNLTQNKAAMQISITPSSYNFSTMPVLPDSNTRQATTRPIPRDKPYVLGQVIVKYHDTQLRATRDAVRRHHSAMLLHSLDLINAELWKVENVEAVVNAQIRAADRAIEYIEPDYYVFAALQPQDPQFNQLWGLNNNGQNGGQADADIDAPEAWDITQGSNEVICAVIDTGVDYTHIDLAANMWVNPSEIANNGVDDDDNGYVDDVYGYDFVNNDGNPQDDHGHGTHVAGTIAAVGNNNIGVTGVNWRGKIAALKFLGANGKGSTSNAIRAVEYANKMGFPCTNNSWGGSSYSQGLYDAIAKANNQGSLFLAAAGNFSLNNDNNPHFPASYDLPNIISVCASDDRDRLASFSHYGISSVDICAPGVPILSTWPNNQYLISGGTSMATPYVTGAAMLLQAQYPYLSALQLKALLMNSAEIKSALLGSSITGGRLNAHQALISVAPPKTFKVQNLGNAIVRLNGINVNNINTSAFSLINNTCSNSLGIGEQCEVTIAYSPTTRGQKQGELVVEVGSNIFTSSLSGNTNIINETGANSVLLEFAEQASYNVQSGQATLPSIIVGEQVFQATLCPLEGLRFKVCDIQPTNNITSVSNRFGDSIFDAETGIVDIAVITFADNQSDRDNISLPTQYEVQMQTFDLPDGIGVEVINAVPIW